MKTKQTSIYSFLAAILALAFTTLSLTTCEPPTDDIITYTVAADNATGTAAINFTFSASVSGLTAGNITVTNGTGSVTKGALSGNGTSWSLAVTVVTAGNVTVSIDKAGIESGNKTVTVSKLLESENITYTATSNSTDNTTAINFTFSASVSGLTAANITVADDTGSVTKGALNGSGTSWSLAVTVVTAGNVTVSISKAGIESGNKTVAVYNDSDGTELPGLSDLYGTWVSITGTYQPYTLTISADTIRFETNIGSFFQFSNVVWTGEAENTSNTYKTDYPNGYTFTGTLTSQGFSSVYLGFIALSTDGQSVCIGRDASTANSYGNSGSIFSHIAVTLNKTSFYMQTGTTETLIATVLPGNTSNQTVSWSSSDTGVATVSENGLITAVALGTATITVTTADSGKTASCTVTVIATSPVAVTGVTLNKTTLSLSMGNSETLIASVLPSSASNKEVSWSSGNQNVATVSESGLVTAVALGTATITVTTADGGKNASCTVTVITAANGKYSGTTWVLYEYALNGVNTIVFGNDTVTFTGSLFTGKSRTAWLRNDSRDVVGEHTSMINAADGVYYDYNNGTGIRLGLISGDELSVLVEDKGSAYSTRTFRKIYSGYNDSFGLTGYIDSNGNVHIQWNAVSNASQYQICFIDGGTPYQFSSSGAPSGYVTANSYTGPYPYWIANDPEIRTFVVRAMVNGQWSGFSSPAQFYPDVEIIIYDEYPNYTFTSTVWNDGSGGGISFGEDTITLTGSYWGTVGIEAGTYRSFILGTSGWLIQVITDEGNNTGFQIVGLVNNLDVVYGLQVQEKLPHIFSKTE